MRQSDGVTRLSAKILVFICPATLLFFYSGWTDAFNLPKLWILSVLAVSLIVTILLEIKDQSNLLNMNSQKRRIILFLYIGFIASVAIPALTSSNVTKSLLGAFGRNNGLLYYSSVIAICLIIILAIEIKIVFASLIKGLGFGFSFLILYSFVQFLDLDPISWQNPFNRIIGTVGNPNFSSSALAVASIFFFYKAWENFKTSNIANLVPIVNFLMSIISAVLSVATQSLQGVIVLASGFVLVLLSQLGTRGISLATRLQILSISLFSGLFLFASFMGLGPLGSKLEQYTLQLRFTYVQIGLRAMMEKPLTGFGVDNYLSAFKLFRTQDFIDKYGVYLQNNNAHSVPLQVGSSFGVLAFSLYLLIHLLILLISLRNVLRFEGINHSLRLISIIWILVFAQSLLSIEQIGLGVMNWVLGAVIATAWASQEHAEVPVKNTNTLHVRLVQWRFPLGKEISILIFTCLSLTFLIIHKEEKAFQIIRSLDASDNAGKTEIVSQSRRFTFYTLNQPEKLRSLLPKFYDAQMSNEIEKWILNCYSKNTDDILAIDMKARLLWSQGKKDESLKYFSRMVSLDPLNYPLWLELAMREIDSGEIGKARVSLNKVLALAPNSTEASEAIRLLGTIS